VELARNITDEFVESGFDGGVDVFDIKLEIARSLLVDFFESVNELLGLIFR
jgi:hypothetical protein